MSVIIILDSYALSCGRLDDIVKTREDSEYSRLSHYNKGLKLLQETLESETTRHKGKNLAAPLLSAEDLHMHERVKGSV